MFKVLQTQHVLAVKDLGATEKYFVEKLGFTVWMRPEGWSFLKLDTFLLMVGHCKDDMSARETNNLPTLRT